MKQVIKVSTIYGLVGWCVYSGENNILKCPMYKTRKAAIKAMNGE